MFGFLRDRKKNIIFMVIFMIVLSGCSLLSRNKVKTLKSWSFQENESTKDYSLFFGLLNESGKYISADVDINIRIVNDEGETVYSDKKTLNHKDFDNYSSKALGNQYLANVRINVSDIKKGKSKSGKVFFTVYKDNKFTFDEVNCLVNCLPVSDIKLTVTGLPIELKVKDFNGAVKSIIKIEDVSYVFENDYSMSLKIKIYGQKIYGSRSSYDIISCKLYDSKGYLIESKNIYLNDLNAGDKFKDDSINVYKITPGENYILKFFEYKY